MITYGWLNVSGPSISTWTGASIRAPAPGANGLACLHHEDVGIDPAAVLRSDDVDRRVGIGDEAWPESAIEIGADRADEATVDSRPSAGVFKVRIHPGKRRPHATLLPDDG